MAVEEKDTRPVPKQAKEKGYNPPPETPNQPTKHQVPPKPRKKDE